MALVGNARSQIIDQSETDTQAYKGVRSYVDLTPDELKAKIPDLQSLDFAIDKEKAQDELRVVLGHVGYNVQQFFQKIPDIVSREDIEMECRWSDGTVERARPQTFSYLAISQSTQGALGLREYRTDATGKPVEPTGLREGVAVTRGFASTAILFYPAIRSDSSFRYLGRQKLDGRETDVIAFAQRPGWAQAAIRANVGGHSVQLLVQGLAWVDPTSYQIIRLRTDLLAPRPEVGLASETTEINYQEVRFPEMTGISLWLPQEVTVVVERKIREKAANKVVSAELPGRDTMMARQSGSVPASATGNALETVLTYRNTHHYSDYKLFSTKTQIVY